MLWKIVKADLARSKLINVTLTAFVCAAAMLFAAAAAIIVKLSGSVDALMTAAAAPDYMQMHAGEFDAARMARFAKESPLVRSYQTLTFLNIDGAAIRIGDTALSDSVQDNGLCVQSETFDFLVGNDGKALYPSAGEIYLPLCYAEDAPVGGDVYVCGRRFTLAGFLRDAQMESSFASSKRFLVNPADYAALRAQGTEEYLIEFLLTDRAAAGRLETAYAAAGLEANGPAVTYALFRLMNALSGGILAGAVILLGVILVWVAFLCIRFTLLAKLEEDRREIGVMRAIGLARGDIVRIYLGKYALIAALGCLLGLAFSVPARGLLLHNMRLYMDKAGAGFLSGACGALGAALLFVAITAYVRGVLRHAFRQPIPMALRACGAAKAAKGIAYRKLSALGVNAYLGLGDLFARRKLYGTFLLVLLLASFIVIVPQNLYTTVKSDSFIGYMGSGVCDMRIDLQQAEDIAGKAVEIEAALASDPDVVKYAVFTTENHMLRMPDGSVESIHIDLGRHELFPAQYAEGGAPANEEEIALSALEAKALDKKTGDTLTLETLGVSRTLRVCGVYADITNGGKTAKALFPADAARAMRYMFAADFAPAKADARIEAYRRAFAFAKVSDVEKYVGQTLGGSISAMRTAALASLLASLTVCMLITALFVKMLVLRDADTRAVLRAIGFTARDLRAQYMTRVCAVALLGFVLGALLANTLGERLAGALIVSLGASGLRFDAEPLRAYLLCPALLILSVLLPARMNLKSVAKTDIHAALGDA